MSATRLLALTFYAVFIEISVCVWALLHVRPIWLIPLLLAAYHVGYLVARSGLAKVPIQVRQTALLVLSAVAGLGLLLPAWWLLGLALPPLSALLQVARRGLKAQTSVPSVLKNAAKVLGMVGAASMALPTPIPTLLFVFFGACAALFDTAVSPPQARAQVASAEDRRLLWFELLHHAHYFAYCYMFWLLLGANLLRWVGPLFTLGWLGYFVLEWLLREHTAIYRRRLLVAGHLACSALLVAMLVVRTPSIIIALWAMTGLAGGTAYMLGNRPIRGDRELFEDAGHVAGCLGASLVVAVTQRAEASIMLGAVCAVCAAAAIMRSPVRHVAMIWR